MKSTRVYLFTVMLLMLSAVMPALAQQHQVTFNSSPAKANFQLFDDQGHLVSTGRTPSSFMIKTGKEYHYQLRHPHCHADSGVIVFSENRIDTTITLRPYSADIHWEVSPSDANVTIHDQRDKHHTLRIQAEGETQLNASRYTMTLTKKDYRRHIEKVRLSSDTSLVIRYQLQHCPRRLILSLSGGLSPKGGIPLGLTAAYGGVHGFYGRFLKTWFNVASGDDFTTDVLVDALYNPYSDVKSEYLSFVAGYQYYMPSHIYLQLGAGFGSLKHNWLSSDDNLRHVYSPDNLSGLVLDLGVGYPIDQFYIGAAVQSVLGSAKSEYVSMPPVIAFLNFGIIL